jgi:phage shock protein C
MTDQPRRLYRSQTNKVIAGVCGGIGEYLNVDPTLSRVAVLALTILGGSGLLLYLIAFFIMPEGPVAADGTPAPARSSTSVILGGLLVVIGGLLLMDNLDILSFRELRHLSWDFLFPGLLILAGVYALTRSRTVPPASPEPAPPPAAAEPSAAAPVSAKTLKRSARDRKLFGICGGLGEYFDIDPTIIRLLYIVFTFMTGGAGILIYFILFFVVPEERIPAKA